MTNKMFDVIVIGELNVDLILNNIDSFPEMGKEKLAANMDLLLGSSSAIFASNLSSLGAKVSFLGKIGEDIFGNLVVNSLNSKKVNTELIIKDKNLKTGATIVLNYDEDRAMVTHAGAMEDLSLKDIPIEKLKMGKHVHISSIFLQPKLRKDILDIFKLAKKLGLTTSLDTQWDPAEKWDLNLSELLPFVDVFLPNEQELLHLTKKNDLKSAISEVIPYANILVVKRGSKGSISWHKGKQLEVPAFFNKNVIDAIGAGDSFDAGFIFKYITDADIEVCQRFGNMTGAVNTTAAGGTTAFSNYEQVVELAARQLGYSE